MSFCRVYGAVLTEIVHLGAFTSFQRSYVKVGRALLIFPRDSPDDVIMIFRFNINALVPLDKLFYRKSSL